MSYFDPKIYNKQNLKEEDRKELDFYEGLLETSINCVLEDEVDDEVNEAGILAQIKKEIYEECCNNIKELFGMQLQMAAINIIDDYENEVEAVENPETYD